MLSVSEAVDLILSETPPSKIIEATVDTSIVGSVLAEDVYSTEPVPAYRASIVDGYAVIVSPTGPSTKGIFLVASVSHAAPGTIPPLQDGQIARITTGAPLPPNATSVVMVEDTVLKTTKPSPTDPTQTEEETVEILTSAIKPGENVREIGSDIAPNTLILRAGEEITAVGGELGLLASVGQSKVKIYKKPTIGVLSTGDEIIDHLTPRALSLGEVRDTNRPTLLSAIRGWGFEAIDLGIADDAPSALEETLRAALRRCDVVVTSGGVSMGELDLLKPTIERTLGGNIRFGRVSMKPGKPTTFATVPVKNDAGERVTKLVFGLPGNPASAVVTAHLFLLPSLHKAAGVQPVGLPRVKVSLEEEVVCDKARPEYHRVRVMAGKEGGLGASRTGGQRSSMVGSLRSANALLCLPAKEGKVAKGEVVDALLMGRVVGAL